MVTLGQICFQNTVNPRKSIGILGGTFDPIHFGHLRAALEIFEQFSFQEVRLIPCKSPVHRTEPLASAVDRVNMVKIAIENSPLLLDEKEMRREGPSYSVDTLTELRKEYPDASLCMIIGVDAFLDLPSWHEWEKLLDLTNIIVMCRAGWEMPTNGVMYNLFKKSMLKPKENIINFNAGKILSHQITALNISASTIRGYIQSGYSPQFLLPAKVWEYIQQHALYAYCKDRLNSQIKEVL